MAGWRSKKTYRTDYLANLPLKRERRKKQQQAKALLKKMNQMRQEHLKFKNIPIDGPEKAFVEALCQNEFHLVNDGQFGAALRGRFTGKTVDVFVIPTSEGTTSRVAVNYPSPDNWGSLRLDFYTLLRSLSFKYGEPVEMTQEFQLPFSDGDGRGRHDPPRDRQQPDDPAAGHQPPLRGRDQLPPPGRAQQPGPVVPATAAWILPGKTLSSPVFFGGPAKFS